MEEKLKTMSKEGTESDMHVLQKITWLPESPTRSLSLLYLVDLDPGTTTPSMDWPWPSREVRAALKTILDKIEHTGKS